MCDGARHRPGGMGGTWAVGGDGASGVAEGSRVTRQRIGHSCRPGKVSSTGECVSHRSDSKAFNLQVAVHCMPARGLGAAARGMYRVLLGRVLVVVEGPGVGEQWMRMWTAVRNGWLLRCVGVVLRDPECVCVSDG